MIWLLVFAFYQAPPDAVDWDGSWKIGMTKIGEGQFKSEAECRNFAAEAIGRIHQGMLAPIRFRCVPFDASLPKGAQR